MTKWIIITSLLITLGIFGFFYMQSLKDSGLGDPDAATNLPAANEIPMVHSFNDGVHRYGGQLKLAHSCYSVTAETIGDPADHRVQRITLKVVDNMAKEGFCSQIVTRYPFEVILDAPEDITTTLEVNGAVVPTKIVEVAWQNPKAGGYLNPIEKGGM